MTVTNYLWDEENITLEYDDADTALVEYTYEPELYGNLISERRDSETYQHNYDALGSTRTLTDISGQVADTFEFDALGNVLVHTGSTETPFRWVGEIGYYFDAETEQYSIRARDYEPIVARWKSKDPLGFIDGPNCYVYAQNSALLVVDPDGLAGIPKNIQANCSADCMGSDGRKWTILIFLASKQIFHQDRRLHANISFPLANGVGIGIHIERNAGFSRCCCDSYGFIQMVDGDIPLSNVPLPRIDVVRGAAEPFYKTYKNGQYPRGYPKESKPILHYPNADLSMYDRPYTPFLRSPLGARIPRSRNSSYETCVVCRRKNEPDSLMKCVTWGYSVKLSAVRLGGAIQVRTGSASAVQAACSGNASARFKKILKRDYPNYMYIENDVRPTCAKQTSQIDEDGGFTLC